MNGNGQVFPSQKFVMPRRPLPVFLSVFLSPHLFLTGAVDVHVDRFVVAL